MLVPIIAVSRDPESVYLATSKFEKLGFAGVYHSSVMQRSVFKTIAVRPSLDHWHSIAPDFALTRRCLLNVRDALGSEDRSFSDELIKMIEALPYSLSTESWHAQVRTPLERLMRRRSFDKMADRFAKIATIFGKADPFYMAGTRSRRHLLHNVHVFLIGLLILLEWEPIRQCTIDEVRARSRENGAVGNNQALEDAILIWACIAMTHDTAYLSEHFVSLSEKIANVAREFLPAFDSVERVEPVQQARWPETPHGKVAANLWRLDIPTSIAEQTLEEKYFMIIANAVERHDSKHFSGAFVHFPEWASFLAILCDEVQNWARERLDSPPGGNPFENVTWRLFCLEGIEIVRETPLGDQKWRLLFTFIARDHPEVIAKRFGSGGEEAVRNEFSRIAKTLRANLVSPVPLRLELVVHFATRPGACILEPIDFAVERSAIPYKVE
jgi:hypothetical protein